MAVTHTIDTLHFLYGAADVRTLFEANPFLPAGFAAIYQPLAFLAVAACVGGGAS